MPHLEGSGPQAGEGRWLWQRSPHSSKAADGESWARLSQQEESSQGLPRACQGLVTCCRGSGVGVPTPAVGGQRTMAPGEGGGTPSASGKEGVSVCRKILQKELSLAGLAGAAAPGQSAGLGCSGHHRM